MVADWELRACRNDDPVSGLASLPDMSIDVMLTDPPYSEHWRRLPHARPTLPRMGGGRQHGRARTSPYRR